MFISRQNSLEIFVLIYRLATLKLSTSFSALNVKLSSKTLKTVSDLKVLV